MGQSLPVHSPPPCLDLILHLIIIDMFVRRYRFIINFLLYQGCWFSCVLGAAYATPWLGAAVVAIAVAYHLFAATRPLTELRLLLCVTAIGGCWDSFLVSMGWLQYDDGVFIQGIAPYWIIALWAAFATTLNISLAWFKQHLWLASLFGAIGGPMAYLAGEKLGAVQFSDTTLALSMLAVGWTCLMPSMLLLSRHWSGFDANPAVAADDALDHTRVNDASPPSPPSSSRVR